MPINDVWLVSEPSIVCLKLRSDDRQEGELAFTLSFLGRRSPPSSLLLLLPLPWADPFKPELAPIPRRSGLGQPSATSLASG